MTRCQWVSTMVRWIWVLASLSAVSCQLLERSGVRLAANSLSIKEITQVMRDEDPTGRNHSIHVVITDHEPLEGVEEWTLLLHTPDEEIIRYTTTADEENPSLQTEFLFQGNLVTANSVLLQAKNSSSDIAMAYMVVTVEDLRSRISWVGGPSSAIRVYAVEDNIDNIEEGKSCSPSDGPCYYLDPDPSSSNYKRCINITLASSKVLMHCDERVTSFTEMATLPPISLLDDGYLELEFTFNGNILDIEVLAYDPVNTSRIFSDYPFKCRFPVGQMWEEGVNIKCRQQLSLPEDQGVMKVLVVVIDTDGDAAQSSLQDFDKNANMQLRVEKISKIAREDDPLSMQSSTKITIAHQELRDIVEWKLTLHENSREPITYTVAADGTNPSTQTEIIFDGNLEQSDSIAFQAWNSRGLLSIDYFVMDIKDMDSSVAWVGGEMESPYASLRLMTGQDFSVIEVEEYSCKREDSPCYFISPDSKPSTAELCKNILISMSTERFVKLCDERITEFTEIIPEPLISLREDGKLEVKLERNDRESFKVEVQAYDYDDHGKVFSDTDYNCYIPVGLQERDEDKITCLHDLTLPEDQKEMKVLIVKSDMDGNAIASSLIHYSEKEPKSSSNTGAIVGGVIGTILGLVLIALLIMTLRKRSARGSKQSSHKYDVAQQNDKQETSNAKTVEEGDDSSH